MSKRIVPKFPSDPQFKDLTGLRFSHVEVLEYIGKALTGGEYRTTWKCRCDCGSIFVRRTTLVKKLKSCGVKGCSHRRGSSPVFHPLYSTWVQMRFRCDSESCKDYHAWGGRGIKVCNRWRDFETFAKDVGPKPNNRFTLHRMDNDGDYKPTNVTWADAKTQSRNGRHNRMITCGGKTLCLSEWSEITGIPRQNIAYHLNNGKSLKTLLKGLKCRKQTEAKRQRSTSRKSKRATSGTKSPIKTFMPDLTTGKYARKRVNPPRRRNKN